MTMKDIKRYHKMTHQALPTALPDMRSGFNKVDTFNNSLQGNFPADYDVYDEVLRNGNYNELEMSFLNNCKVHEAGDSSASKISQVCRISQIDHIRGHFTPTSLVAYDPEESSQFAKLVKEENQAAGGLDVPVGPEVEQMIQATPNGIYSMVSHQGDSLYNDLKKEYLKHFDSDQQIDVDADQQPPEPAKPIAVEEEKPKKELSLQENHTGEGDCPCASCKNASNLIAEEDKEKIATKKNQKKKKKKKAKKKKEVEDDSDDEVEETAAENNKPAAENTTPTKQPTKHADPYSDENDDVDIGKLSNKVEMINTEEIVSARLFSELSKTSYHENAPAEFVTPKTKKGKQKSSRSSSFSQKAVPPKSIVDTKVQRSMSITSPVAAEEKPAQQKKQQQQSNNGWIQVKNKKEEANHVRPPPILTDNYDSELKLVKYPTKPSFVNMVPILELKASPYKAKLLMMDAQLSEGRGEFEKAVNQSTMALQYDPNNPAYYVNRSYYHEQLGNYQQALADANKAITLDKFQEFAYFSYFRYYKALLGLGEWTGAESTIISLIDLNRKFVETRPTTVHDHHYFLQKEAMVLRLKALVTNDYSLPLARIYALRYNRIDTASEALENNIKYFCERGMDNPYDENLHKELIKQQKANQRATKNTAMTAIDDEVEFDYQTEEDEGEDIDSGDEIFFSDDEEYDMFNSDPESFAHPKIILEKSCPPNRFKPVTKPEKTEVKDDATERSIFVKHVDLNIWPPYITNVFMKFGNVLLLRSYLPANPQDNGAGVMIVYDNAVSARLAMAYLHNKHLPLMNHKNKPLLVSKYQQKGETPNPSPLNECYHYRGNGCDQFCGFQHVPDHKGVEKGATKSAIKMSNKTKAPRTSSPAVERRLSTDDETWSPVRSTSSSSPSEAECRNWRTTGCTFGPRCYFKHFSESKGVDQLK